MTSNPSMPSSLKTLYRQTMRSLESVGFNKLYAASEYAKNLKDDTLAHGIYYGYPECCAMAFSMGWHGGIKSYMMPQSQSVPNVGMVTCPECTKKLLKSSDRSKAAQEFRLANEERRLAYWDVYGASDLLFAYLSPKFKSTESDGKAALFMNELFSQFDSLIEYFKLGGTVVLPDDDERVYVESKFGVTHEGESHLLSVDVKTVNKLTNRLSQSVTASKEFYQHSRLTFGAKRKYIAKLLDEAGVPHNEVLIAGQTSLSYWDASVYTPVILLQPTNKNAWKALSKLSGFTKVSERDFPIQDRRSAYLVRYSDMIVLDSSLFDTGFIDNYQCEDISLEMDGLVVTDEVHSYVACFAMNYFLSNDYDLEDIFSKVANRNTLHPSHRNSIIGMLKGMYA
ncbi:hypothetical protein [Vibrio owensii]|uniref:hypothetical protein n=1 Tax=Vibrio owensii TaxID=696485 RepID=UPI003CC67E27